MPQGPVAAWRVLPYANIAHITGGEWAVEFAESSTVHVRSGEALCIAAGVRHRSIMLSEGTSYSNWAHFNILLFGYIDIFWFFDLPGIMRGETADRLGEILRRLSQLSPGEISFCFC